MRSLRGGSGSDSGPLGGVSRSLLIQWSLALVISVILWVIAMRGQSFTYSEMLPVAPRDLPPAMIVMEGPSPDSVLVTISGDGLGLLWSQLTLRPEAVSWNWPVFDSEYPHRYEHELSGRDLRFADGGYPEVGSVSFNPQTVTIIVDRELSRTLPVKAMVTGDIPVRYFLPDLSVTSVEVIGAASVLGAIDSCTLTPVEPEAGTWNAAFVQLEGIASVNPPSVRVRMRSPVPVVRPGAIAAGLNPY